MAKKKKLDTKIDDTIGFQNAVYDGNFPFAHVSELDNRDKFTPGVYDVKGAGKGFTLPDPEAKGTVNDSIQDIIREKVPERDYYVGPDGAPYFKNWNQEDVKDLDILFQSLNMGTLEKYKGPLEKIIRNIDENGAQLDFDVGEFQDVIAKFFTKDIDEVAPRIKIDELKEAAMEMERSAFYSKLLNRKSTEGMSNEMFMRTLIESQILIVKLKQHSNFMMRNGYTEAADKAWQDMFNYLGVLIQEGTIVTRTAMQKGAIVQNVGRGEFTMPEFLDGLKNIAEDLNDDSMPMGPNRMMDNVANFVGLANSQIEYAAGVARRKGPTWADAAAELYVNAKLWHPWTLGINGAGNMGMQMLDMVETFTAGVINKIPGFSSEEGVALAESMDYLYAMTLGAKRGLKQMREYKKTGTTIGGTNKIDQRHQGNAISSGLIENTKLANVPVVGDVTAFGLNAIGGLVNVPKHAMIFQDEFTKGIIFDVELMKLAHRERNTVLKRTGDQKMADEAYESVIHLTGDNASEITKKVNDAMATRTFQAELPDGIFKKVQSIANHPGMKYFMPFYKTMVNIYFETGKRTPLGALSLLPGVGKKIMPTVRKDLLGDNGKAAQQLALSRMAIGTAFLTQLSDYVYMPGDLAERKELVITGMPPVDPNEQAAFFQEGLIPYAECVLDKKTDKYRCLSYAHLEPMGTLLGASADAVQLAQMPSKFGDEGGTAEDTFYAWFNVAYDYLGRQSFIEVFSHVDEFFGGQNGRSGQMLDGVFGKLVDVFDSFASAGMGRSSKFIPNYAEIRDMYMNGNADTYLTRLFDENRKNYGITSEEMYDENFFVKLISGGEAESWSEYYDGNIPPGLESFYKHLNKVMYESPFYNPSLKPELTEFGAEVKDPRKRYYAPVSEADGSLIYNFMNSTGLYLDYSAKKLGPIKLTSDEKHDFIKYMNEDLDGDGESDYKVEIRNLISSTEFLMMGNTYNSQGENVGKKLQQQELRAIQTYYHSKAGRNMLMDPNHSNLLSRYAEYYDAIGDVGLPRLDNNIVDGF